MDIILSLLFMIGLGLGLPIAFPLIALQELITEYLDRRSGKKRTYESGSPGVFIYFALICGAVVACGLVFLTYFAPIIGISVIVAWAFAGAFVAHKLGFI